MNAVASPRLDADTLLETAGRMAGALKAWPQGEQRLALLKRIVTHLGDDAYPVFLKLLLVIAESDDDVGKRALADTLALALQRTDLPSGQLSSWGATRTWDGTTPVRAGTFSAQYLATTPHRQLGPIEYLTVWYCQRTQRPLLDEARYADALAKLVDLCNRNPQTRKLYPAKLAADSRNELEGAFTRMTREKLAAIAEAWTPNATPDQVAQAVVGSPGECQRAPHGWILRDL